MSSNMLHIHKVIFPYGVGTQVGGEKLVIFFGADFYNFPKGSDIPLFVEKTNHMLRYIERNFPGCRYLYQPHPNETDEYTHIELGEFNVGEKTIADVLMWKEFGRIEGVFAACSWAAATAYSMGLRAGVFLDQLSGAVPDDALMGWRSYFEGFPDSFFIRSLDSPVPSAVSLDPNRERESFEKIVAALGDAKTVWCMAADPAYGIRASMLARNIKQVCGKNVKFGLLKIRHPRWDVVAGARFLSEFDTIVSVPFQWYTARLSMVPSLLRNILELRRLPITRDDAFISFSHMQFSENAVLSWYPGKKILMTESRWYSFTYEREGKTVSSDGYRRSLGVRFFNYVLEPLLRLHGTDFREYKDGKVLNFFRYKDPLDRVYDSVFVFIPPV